jgi:hypothetical protein
MATENQIRANRINAPATPEELSLVNALIRFEWLSRHYACVDTAIWENRFAAKNTRALSEVFLAESTKSAAPSQPSIPSAEASMPPSSNSRISSPNAPGRLKSRKSPIVPCQTNHLTPKWVRFFDFQIPPPEPEKTAELPREEPDTPPKAA